MQVVSGDAVPGFKVQALDMWRNPCGTWAGMATVIIAECLSLDPPKLEFEVDESGEATIEGKLLIILAVFWDELGGLHRRSADFVPWKQQQSYCRTQLRCESACSLTICSGVSIDQKLATLGLWLLTS